MHSYDLEGRRWIYGGLAVLSVLFVWLLDVGLDYANIDPPWWLSAPPFAGFYTVLYWIFDRHVWRWRILRRLRLLSVPDLNGMWTGEIDSSFGEEGTNRDVKVNIMQRWASILITLQAGESSSRSTMAAFKTRDTDSPELTYTYLNEPRGRATDTMQMHRGTCTLRVASDRLEGDYYTGRGRGTVGELKLVRAR